MSDSLSALNQITDAARGERGLPELIRAVGRALGAGVLLLDAAGSVLVLAGRSSTDEQALTAAVDGVECVPLVAAGEPVGELRLRRPASAPEFPAAATALVYALLAAELGRQQLPAQASEAAASEFLAHLVEPGRREADALGAEADELGIDLARGVTLLVIRAHVQAAGADGWRDRVAAAAWRGARVTSPAAIAAASPRKGQPHAEVLVLLRAADEADAVRCTDAVVRELRLLAGHTIAVGRSRVATDAGDLARLGDEALLAVNVAEGGAADEEGHRVLAFEDTGAYRLLLPAMSEDPDELRRFYDETIAPVAAYDEQYETNLVQTVDAFLEADGNVAGTAQRLFTHRHTIRYRLERVRELSGFDVGSTDGRERLSLGLKAMRVLGIPAPGGPASERPASADQAVRGSNTA